MSTFVLPLADPLATLEIVGGKGASLAKLTQAGLPVPDGFHLTTAAYNRFVEVNGLKAGIQAALASADLSDSLCLETISQHIGSFFTQGTIPPEITQEITAAYAGLSEKGSAAGTQPAVAVRSSATAEDLPEASFAGQQETYLNIRGAEAVLQAVKKCWASLWTARAIAYRARQGISPDSVALAVVVQELVCAEASGVLFTANPVSGKRSEVMITAAWGLGEAIVGGLVTPDTLILEKTTGKLLHRDTHKKEVMTVRSEVGTREQPVPQRLQKSQVLSGSQAADLARLGAEIERLYGMPMDIEWTLAGGRFTILQARPVTSLPEPPLEWVRSNPKTMLARGSFAEFVPDPVSPLFATLAVPIAQEETQRMLSAFFGLKNQTIRDYLFEVVNGYVYIGMVMSASFMWKMTVQSLGQMKAVLNSSKARWAVVRAKSRELAERWQAPPAGPCDLNALPAPALLAGVREIFSATAEYYTVAQSGPIPGALSSEAVFGVFYRSLVRRKSDPEASAFLLGLETVPLRAEKSLYDLAMWAKEQPEIVDYLQRTPMETVREALQADPTPAPLGGEFAKRMRVHLAAFGHAIYDLDFTKPVPADDPAPVLEGLKAYMAGQAGSPYQRQAVQVDRREKAAQAILARLDPLRRKWFTKLLKWAQDTGPDREDCIADMGLGYPQIRALLRELGRRLAAGGAIAQVEDVYWLEAAELDALAAAVERGDTLAPQTEKVERRKAFWRRARGVNPPISIPEKSFISGLLAHDNPAGSTLKGYAASGGKVTARACVLRGPEEFINMRPGDVIVAVTTTPAWTPLFAMASAVVTDIGGPLSHSSIVAREYGIPAVMATGVASKRIQHGQIITVDGSKGLVTLEAGV